MVKRWLAFLLIGILTGMGLATLRMGADIERLTMDNAILIDEVERLAGMLDSRERALTLQRQAPVHSVEVEVVTPQQEHIRLHIEQRAHELLRHLVGEEVDQLNASLIETALSRTIVVDQSDYTITPTLILLGQRVYVRLEARLGKSESSKLDR